MRNLPLLPALAVTCALLAGCGGDEDEDGDAAPARPPPPAEEVATDVADPGAPAKGEPDYAGLGTWWRALPDSRRLASAEEFIADNPAECADVSAEDLERQTGIAFGYDFPEATPTDQVMLETCALLRDGA